GLLVQPSSHHLHAARPGRPPAGRRAVLHTEGRPSACPPPGRQGGGDAPACPQTDRRLVDPDLLTLTVPELRDGTCVEVAFGPDPVDLALPFPVRVVPADLLV
ncbi:MAG: hypothetical protein JWN17_1593, partial [Frankiales bacterium]|nr:hypothetical protein [Frankiales bacterium]